MNTKVRKFPSTFFSLNWCPNLWVICLRLKKVKLCYTMFVVDKPSNNETIKLTLIIIKHYRGGKIWSYDLSGLNAELNWIIFIDSGLDTCHLWDGWNGKTFHKFILRVTVWFVTPYNTLRKSLWQKKPEENQGFISRRSWMQQPQGGKQLKDINNNSTPQKLLPIIYIYIYIYIYHHHVAPPAQISLTLSRYPSLSSIASSRSSSIYPGSAQSCCT